MLILEFLGTQKEKKKNVLSKLNRAHSESTI